MISDIPNHDLCHVVEQLIGILDPEIVATEIVSQFLESYDGRPPCSLDIAVAYYIENLQSGDRESTIDELRSIARLLAR